MLSEGTVALFTSALVGGISGVGSAHVALGLCVGSAFGLCVALVQRSRGDAAGILFRVRRGILTIARGRKGSIRIAEVPIGDVLDVRIENETLLAPIGNIVAAPSFGMDATHGRRPAATVDEARIAVVLRTRVEPILLTTNRISNIDATEWLKDIHEFLRGCGWRAAEKIEPATEPRTILLLRVDGTEYTIRVKTRASAFVLEALRLEPGEKEATTHEYVIEAEDLPTFTSRLLEESDDRERYEQLEEPDALIELVRDVFVTPHGVASIGVLTEWLDREGIAYGFSRLP